MGCAKKSMDVDFVPFSWAVMAYNPPQLLCFYYLTFQDVYHWAFKYINLSIQKYTAIM